MWSESELEVFKQIPARRWSRDMNKTVPGENSRYRSVPKYSKRGQIAFHIALKLKQFLHEFIVFLSAQNFFGYLLNVCVHSVILGY